MIEPVPGWTPHCERMLKEVLCRLEHPRPEHHRAYRRHVVIGERIVRGVGLDEVADAIRHHHERWDGSGYPDRIAREEIPSLARLARVLT